jgi:hypothetical protein
VIWLCIATGLYVGLLYPVVDRRSAAFDTQPPENCLVLERDMPPR